MPARRLSDWCHDRLDAMLADLRLLVTHESPSSRKPLLDKTASAITTWLTDRLGRPDECHRHQHDDCGDLLETVYCGTTATEVVLLGHYDTVWPEGTLADWPFEVRDGEVTGPGVFDMKAGLATGVWALRALRELDLPRPTVRLLFNGDEELGSPHSRARIEEAAAGAAATLVLEPGSGWDVKTERKGVGIFALTTTGVESHAGLDPAAGASAVHALCELVGRLVAAQDLGAGTTINVGTITGGSARNVVAASASCLVDIRVESTEEAERIDRVLAGLRPADPRVTVAVHGRWSRPPMRLTPSGRRLFALADEVATELRGPLGALHVGGGSDANFLAALGFPVLDGLGASGGGAHARHEHVLLEALPHRTALVAGLLHRLTTERV
ncbi:glutamate carboxypeptidase [Saccharopolyspora erythraea NRRL 2338]|uniref:Carboxypeptidase G2 n=2 Tax=Saccharopolyspora erythraea TaxID=1836 RepID=A4FIV3_SACEN|nr:M20 family metallopeptidase [Saccharopolyspora erythraea]EQD83296.1 peptidase M20 [Saccharopolyspora erythraea D]PFG97651.1 glutamate carboxypeptidase [Saccharopolyspora erythraea NRRL 2338]QRK87808.1 M20 family metallopeptidase [Saccharopolyspora erythraea]CAM03978.1 carboxypeptidase G2 [Saccharopolyspora erythraea NRRL 2338]